METKKTEQHLKTQSMNSRKKLTFPKLGDMLENRFRIVEQLGEGAFSVTYKAYDTAIKLEKTLKVFGLYVEVFHYLPEIRQEAKLYQTVLHEGLPIFYEMYETDYVYFEMEYIAAKDLRTVLNKSIDRNDKISYAIQLAEVMYQLHFFEVEHNDLKPENVLISEDKSLYLIDLGTAALDNLENTYSHFEGTPEYCPPETKTKEEKPYARDIFAFGVILYEIFYGKYPFEKDAEGNISYRIPNHIISSGNRVNRIIKKCLYFFQDDRYQNFKRIIDDLNDLIAKETDKHTQAILTEHTEAPTGLMHNFKKDLIYLWISFIVLAILLPIGVVLDRQKGQIENYIDFEGPPYSVYLNSLPIGETGTRPLHASVKKGDIISFVNQNDITDFEMTYDKEKRIRLTRRGNRIYVNNKLQGLHITENDDIPKNVNFLSIRGDVNRRKLSNLKNKNLHIGITNAAPFNLLNDIPRNTKSLSMRNFAGNINLSLLAGFNNLTSLDLANSRNINLTHLPQLLSLHSLNLENTNAQDIRQLGRFRNLKNLNLASNFLDSISPITNNREIERLNINNNQNIHDFEHLTALPKLRQLLNNNPIPNDQNRVLTSHQERNAQEIQRLQRIIITHKNQLQRIFNIILFIFFGLISTQIIIVSAKAAQYSARKRKKEAPPTAENELFDLVDKKPDLNLIRQLNAAILDKRLFYPANNNALSWLYDLAKEMPNDELVVTKKEEVMNEIALKIKSHQTKKEYEPIFIAAATINEYFPDNANYKLIKYARKKLERSPFIKFITIKGGAFGMGDFKGNTNHFHPIKLNSFKISDTPITNAQFCKFLNEVGNVIENGQTFVKVDSQYSRITLNYGVYTVKEPYDAFPVYEVSWFGARRFCEWLGGRLPTEAEWEFAARSRGLQLIFATGNEINKKNANYLENEKDTSWHSLYPVKSYSPNKIGLYDMSGNILEWCNDWFDSNYYFDCPQLDPQGPDYGELKVARGGAWCFGKDQCYTYFRSAQKPSARNNYTGFRVVIPVDS